MQQIRAIEPEKVKKSDGIIMVFATVLMILLTLALARLSFDGGNDEISHAETADIPLGAIIPSEVIPDRNLKSR